MTTKAESLELLHKQMDKDLEKLIARHPKWSTELVDSFNELISYYELGMSFINQMYCDHDYSHLEKGALKMRTIPNMKGRMIHGKCVKCTQSYSIIIQPMNLILGDCLEKMKDIPDGSVDMILTDPPYGTTACKWDTIIPFEPMWEQCERVIKSNGAIVLFGQEPFSSNLRSNNFKLYKYDWIWEKDNHSNFLNIKKQPAKRHELISVFYKKQPTYNPQMWEGKENHSVGKQVGKMVEREYLGNKFELKEAKKSNLKYPTSILRFKGEGRGKAVHPTQKPVALLEYLIKTYTNEGETVLDFAIGSGSTGVACVNTGRNFIGIEKDENYFKIAQDRIFNHQP